MKYTTHRFRIAKPSAGGTTPGRPSGSSVLSPSSAAGGSETHDGTEEAGRSSGAACQRCRRLKKRCSKTIPGCEQCCNAGQACSLAGLLKPRPTSPRQLQSRIDFLTRYIDENLPKPFEAESEAQCNPEEQESEKQRSSIAALDKPPDHHITEGIADAADGNDDVSMSSLADGSEIPPPGSLVLAKSNGPVVSPIALSPQEVQHGQAGLAARHMLPINAFFRHVHRAYPFVDKRRIMITANRAVNLEAQQSDPDIRVRPRCFHLLLYPSFFFIPPLNCVAKA
jgi:hypothetical protein